MSLSTNNKSALPDEVISKMIKVLKGCLMSGQKDVTCFTFASRYNSMFGESLDFSAYGFSSVRSMLETLAELGHCNMMFSPNQGVCVSYKTPIKVDDVIDLDAINLPWYETGCLPYGAVDMEKLEEQSIGDIENSPYFFLHITEVESVNAFWICLLDFIEARDKMMEDLDEFYLKSTGRKWIVPKKKFCKKGRLMAAPYKNEGYHRVRILKYLGKSTVSVFYIDFGTKHTVTLDKLRLLHKRFLDLPAQAIKVRLWGCKDNEDLHVLTPELSQSFYRMAIDGNFISSLCGICMPEDNTEFDIIDEESEYPVGLWVLDIIEEISINERLVEENVCSWNMSDLQKLEIQMSKLGRSLWIDAIKVVTRNLPSLKPKIINIDDSSDEDESWTKFSLRETEPVNDDDDKSVLSPKEDEYLSDDVPYTGPAPPMAIYYDNVKAGDDFASKFQ